MIRLFLATVASVSLMGLAAPSVTALAAPRDDKPKPKFPLGKDTTVVDGPLDKDGYIDYEAALNERLGKGVTAEKNANVLIWKALGPRPEGGEKGMPKEYFQAMGIEEPPAKGDYFMGMGRYIHENLRGAANENHPFYDQQSRSCSQPWSGKEFPDLHAWLVLNAKPLELAVEASKRSAYFNPLTPPRWPQGRESLLASSLPCIQRCREIVAALTARAMLKLHDRKYDDAWQDLLAAHRLARHIGQGGTLIEALVCMACDQIAGKGDLIYLEHANLTGQQIRDRLSELRKLPPLPSIADRIDTSERFTYLDNLQLIRRHGLGILHNISGGKMPEKPDADEENALAAIDWEPALRDGNRWFDRLVASVRAPTRAEREALYKKLEDDLRQKKNDLQPGAFGKLLSEPLGKPNKAMGKGIGDVMITHMLPAAGRVQGGSDRTEQAQRNLHLAFALHAYKKDTGKYPQKLADLAPNFLPSIPDDLFSGKPLVYKSDDKGFLLYSVGPNGTDDAGRSYGDDPPGDDITVRMPRPSLKK